jgi:hypothetical protein
MSKFVAGVLAARLVILLGAAVVRGSWKFWEPKDSALIGDVVLKKVQAKSELRVAAGEFDVPVVVCRDTAVPFIDGKSEQGDTIADFCRGPGAESSTLLVPGTVAAIVSFRDIKLIPDTADPARVTVQVPEPKLEAPVVESKNIVPLARSSSRIPNTDLPEDFQQKAAKEAEKAITKVAANSGILAIARSSAKSQLKDLMELAYKKVDVVFVTAPTGGN